MKNLFTVQSQYLNYMYIYYNILLQLKVVDRAMYICRLGSYRSSHEFQTIGLISKSWEKLFYILPLIQALACL
jgi:hypothetical protein